MLIFFTQMSCGPVHGLIWGVNGDHRDIVQCRPSKLAMKVCTYRNLGFAAAADRLHGMLNQ